MKIIAFQHTTPALLAGRKTRTRRKWKDSYARRFKVGDICQAYDKSPRVGGRRVGFIKITGLKQADIKDMLDGEFEDEGFAYLDEHGLKIWGKKPVFAWIDWRNEGGIYWVVDFVLIRPDDYEKNNIWMIKKTK